MTFSAILGLVAFNLVVFGVGATSLYAIRGLRSWNELIRLAGVAYMLGVALTGIVFVFELVVGLSPSLGVILTTAAVLTLAALAVGNRLGRPRPGGRLTLGRISLTGAIFGAAFIVYAEALFRSGRLAGLYEFDGGGSGCRKGWPSISWAAWIASSSRRYPGLRTRPLSRLTRPVLSTSWARPTW
jgi:hypothetical protein